MARKCAGPPTINFFFVLFLKLLDNIVLARFRILTRFSSMLTSFLQFSQEHKEFRFFENSSIILPSFFFVRCVIIVKWIILENYDLYTLNYSKWVVQMLETFSIFIQADQSLCVFFQCTDTWKFFRFSWYLYQKRINRYESLDMWKSREINQGKGKERISKTRLWYFALGIRYC